MGNSNYGYPGAQPPATGFVEPKPAPMPSAGHNSYSAYDEETGGFTSRGFDNDDIRRTFVKKVFLILGIQLLITFGTVCLFTFHEGTKNFIQANSWTYYIAYVFFFSIYIALVCCESVRRKHPQNLIFLGIFTVAFSYMTGTIASFYDSQAVAIALGVTCVVCFAVILFSMQTKFDFTKCSGLLFVLSMCFFLFGIITIFTYSRSWYVQVVYGSLGALLFTLFLAFDVQLVMGGKKYELGPEEHVMGALQLYIDIVYIFLMILSLFGGRD